MGRPLGARTVETSPHPAIACVHVEIREATLAAVFHHEPRKGPERVVPSRAVLASIGDEHQAGSSTDVHVHLDASTLRGAGHQGTDERGSAEVERDTGRGR